MLPADSTLCHRQTDRQTDCVKNQTRRASLLPSNLQCVDNLADSLATKLVTTACKVWLLLRRFSRILLSLEDIKLRCPVITDCAQSGPEVSQVGQKFIYVLELRRAASEATSSKLELAQ